MDYDEIQTPTMLQDELWKISGHWDNYRENMYFSEVEGQRFAIKPMNCPGACLVYRSRRHSYRDLPIRYAEFGHVHRHELSGVLHGLFRVRAFTQDDAHVFCRLDQVRDEVNAVLDLTDRFYARFGFHDVQLKLSTRPEKATGTPGDVGRGRGGAARRPGRPRLRPEDRRRRVLRAEDRLPGDRRDGPLLAARHLPARLPDARALRPRLHDGRGHRGAPGDDPPGDHGVDRALPRHPDREHRRRLPAVARAGAGARAAGVRPPPRLRRVGARAAARRGPARRGRRALGVDRAAHPRRRALQGPLPADRGRQGGRGRHGVGPGAPPRRPGRGAARRARRPAGRRGPGAGRP